MKEEIRGAGGKSHSLIKGYGGRDRISYARTGEGGYSSIQEENRGEVVQSGSEVSNSLGNEVGKIHPLLYLVQSSE